MKKIIIGGLVILAVAVGGSLYLVRIRTGKDKEIPSPPEISPAPAIENNGKIATEPEIEYELIGCKTGDRNLKNNVSFSPLSKGKLHFEQKLATYCNLNEDNFKASSEVEANHVVIREIFDSEIPVKCICLFEISGTISDLEENKEYQVSFIFDNRYTKKEEVVYEGTVETN